MDVKVLPFFLVYSSRIRYSFLFFVCAFQSTYFVLSLLLFMLCMLTFASLSSLQLFRFRHFDSTAREPSDCSPGIDMGKATSEWCARIQVSLLFIRRYFTFGKFIFNCVLFRWTNFWGFFLCRFCSIMYPSDVNAPRMFYVSFVSFTWIVTFCWIFSSIIWCFQYSYNIVFLLEHVCQLNKFWTSSLMIKLVSKTGNFS